MVHFEICKYSFISLIPNGRDVSIKKGFQDETCIFVLQTKGKKSIYLFIEGVDLMEHVTFLKDQFLNLFTMNG